MAKYSDIKGFTVQTVTSDPAASQAAGGSWASGGNINNLRYGTGQAGTSTAGSIFFGYVPAGNSVTVHEYYDGTSFTEQTDGNTARESIFGCGTQTASIAAGGDAGGGNRQALTETWNGSSWTEVGDLNTARNTMGSLGHVNTAGLAFGGVSPGGSNLTITEQWNGSAWTETGDLNQGGYGSSGSGTSTSGIKITIQHPSAGSSKTVEQWDGSSWTEIADVNNAHAPGSQASQQGAYNQALVAGGSTYSVNTENWDGTSWTEVNNLSTGRSQGSGFGTYTDMVVAAGQTTSAAYVTGAEEWSFPPPTAAILTEGSLFLSKGTTLKGFGRAAGIPAATFSSGGTLNNGHGYGGGFGLQTAAICAAGGYPTETTNTENYNGTSWTEVNNLNTARRNVAECGSQSSGVVINGGPPFSANPTSSVEAWDGTSWTAITGTPIGGYSGVGIGTTSTSLLYCGGNNNPGSGGQKIATALEYNGTSWTSISDMGTVREAGMGAARGSTTAGLMYGGETPPGPTANTELWDGSSWTELNNLNDAQSGGGGLGNSTQALSYGGTRPGAPPYQSTKNEFWNGTSWTEVNDLATGRSSGIAPAGGGALGLVSGGQSNPSTQSTASEEWTADNTLSTVTVS